MSFKTAQISKVMSPLEKLEFNFDDQKEVRLNHKPPSLAFNKVSILDNYLIINICKIKLFQ